MLEARIKFEERFYHWAIEDWKREIDQGFPLIKMSNEHDKRFILKIMDNLNYYGQKIILSKVLVKRFTSEEVLKRCNDEMTGEEKKYEKLYLAMVDGAASGAVEIGEYEIFERERTNPCLKRGVFRRYIKNALSPVLGEEYEDWGGGEWRYRTSIGPWLIDTFVDTGGTHHQLCYEHNIIISDHIYLSQSVSLLRWLGISSQTSWMNIIDSDTEPTAKALTKIIAHFMDAAPKLLEGLSPD